MTPEQQRIAIAKKCPFVKWKGDAPFWRDDRDSIIRFDPINDLNAMHEAEQNLGGMDKAEFAVQLCRVVGKDWPSGIGGGSFAHVHATAAQRVEAFLRTLNLYTPTP